MSKVNITLLTTVSGQQLGVAEESKEVVRLIDKFREDNRGRLEGHRWLEFTKPKREGSRKLLLRDDVVESIVQIHEMQIEEPSAIAVPQRPELVR